MNKESIRWVILFMALMAGFYWIDQSQWFQEILLDRLAHGITTVTIRALSFFGAHLKQAGSTVITGAGRIEVARSCTGSFVFMMFAAAVIPFPSPWKWRVKGLFFGLAALMVLNLFRTFMIVLVGSRFPNAIQTFHVIIGQIIVIAGMTTVFLWWAKHPRQAPQISFFSNNRQIFRAVVLFCVGYLCGFWLYRAFLESPAGLFVKHMVEVHTFRILSLLNETFLQGRLSQISAAPVKLVDGCLSSPMVVLFLAVVVAWPTRWWKRALIILTGFIPFFYGYHLLRAILVSLSLGIQSKEVNFAYNFYGQLILVIALFAWAAYLWCFRYKSISCRKFLTLLVPSSLLGLSLALGLGWLMRCFLIPFLTMQISGTPLLSHDPEQMVSLMLDLQVFIWVSLIGSTPGLSLARKCWFALSGITAAFLLLVVAVLLIEIFHLSPHKGMFKLAVVLLPFAAYYISFLYRRDTGNDTAGDT
ncbi:MAG: exosortase/archaeosortase family protein [Deltaproteobacteria bacterium]|nr:exosortase/archaeosortase family protein [Deltaproteobacteria bacterium]